MRAEVQRESVRVRVRIVLVERADRKKAADKVVNAIGECLWRCGLQVGTKCRLAPGHDAKLHSLVLRVSRGQVGKDERPVSEASREYLCGAPWMKPELAEAIRL